MLDIIKNREMFEKLEKKINDNLDKKLAADEDVDRAKANAGGGEDNEESTPGEESSVVSLKTGHYSSTDDDDDY